MSLTRLCGACDKVIQQVQHLEVTIRVIRTTGAETQDAIEQSYDDYCDVCVRSGAALKSLLKGLTRYRGRVK